MIVRRRIRTFYERCISLKGDPGSIARALAIGVFVGVTPTIPFHTAMILLIGLVFRVNITAAYLGSWLISNPVTIPLLYLSQYELGRILLGMEAYRFGITEYSFSAIAALGWRILLPLLTGGIIMAPLIAVPAYFISRRMITAIRAKGCP
jgi:uncharacterized protein (TIGR03546 family)